MSGSTFKAVHGILKDAFEKLKAVETRWLLAMVLKVSIGTMHMQIWIILQGPKSDMTGLNKFAGEVRNNLN